MCFWNQWRGDCLSPSPAALEGYCLIVGEMILLVRDQSHQFTPPNSLIQTEYLLDRVLKRNWKKAIGLFGMRLYERRKME